MFVDSTLEAVLRPERDLKGKWGIYSTRDRRWLDVVFNTKLEAVESLMALRPESQAPAGKGGAGLPKRAG